MIFEGRAMLRLKIREIAEQQGISCRQLARRSGLAESSVRRYWRDPGAHIRTDTLAILAHTLGVSPWRCSMMSRRATQRRYRASGSRMLIDEIARATGRQIRLVARTEQKKRKGTNMMTNEQQLLTIDQVATRLQCARSTVYKLINKQGLPAIKFKDMTRVDPVRLSAWLAERSTQKNTDAHWQAYLAERESERAR